METGVDAEGARGDDELSTAGLEDVVTEGLDKMEEVVVGDPLGSSGVVAMEPQDTMMVDQSRAQQVDSEDDKGENKSYREGPWDVLEMLVLVSAMKEAPGEEIVHDQLHKWQFIENYCWGQLVQRSVPDCHEKWASLSGEFKRIKDFESSMLQQDHKSSYWEMTFDERNSVNLPPDFSQEVYNALWQWDDRDRIGDPGT
jgi:hypothetical protein